ncbi:unnamed protein product [Notodromas monacha]|uniref:Tubulin-specific chaperone E n=1 Tax=Notodromas monacha TaxID=399045 RepID=A0A7R9GF91_9CRUS|nr:unnamed protein product [Notodromas monacha]CAG0918595.1 unnamed protein product [Notodromas monacha]
MASRGIVKSETIRARFCSVAGLAKDYCGAMSVDLGPEPGLLDEVLKYGLYLGAIFQLICIAAVILVPFNSSLSAYSQKDYDSGEDEGSDQGTPSSGQGFRERALKLSQESDVSLLPDLISSLYSLISDRFEFPELESFAIRNAIWSKCFSVMRDGSEKDRVAALDLVRVLSRDKADLDEIITKHPDYVRTLTSYAVLDKISAVNPSDIPVVEAALKVLGLNVLERMLEDVVKAGEELGAMNPEKEPLGSLDIFASPRCIVTSADADLVCIALQVLYNLTLTPDPVVEDLQVVDRLVGLIRKLLLSSPETDHSKKLSLVTHVSNLLCTVPPACFQRLITVGCSNGAAGDTQLESDPEAMKPVAILLAHLDARLADSATPVDSLVPILVGMSRMGKANSFIRKYMRNSVLPRLRRSDVMRKPEEGNTLRNRLVRLLTHPSIMLKEASATFLFMLCKENAGRMVKYSGLGNAAGMLSLRGLMGGARSVGAEDYSPDSSDSDTEEYKDVVESINPVTGCFEPPRRSATDGMTDEQKEVEAMRLIGSIENMILAKIPEVGVRIVVKEIHFGTVKYVGPVCADASNATWLGVEWDDPTRGKHDGSIGGQRYFQTSSPKSGSFIKPHPSIKLGIDVTEALEEKYCGSETNPGEAELVEVSTALHASLYETVGFEKINAKQKALKQVSVIELVNCRVGHGKLSGDKLPVAKVLNLSHNLISSWKILRGIVADLTKLRVLDLRGNRLTWEPGVVFPLVQELDVCNCNLTWTDFLRIGEMFPDLRELGCDDNRVSPDPRESEILKRSFPKLEMASLSLNPISKAEHFKVLGSLPKLTSLRVMNVGLTSVKLDEDSFPCLESLNISDNPIDSWESVDELGKVRSLKSLRLRLCPVLTQESDGTLSHLSTCSILARVLQLTKLNGTVYPAQERHYAEWDYLRLNAHAYYASLESSSSKDKFQREHPTFGKLIQKHGEPPNVAREKTSALSDRLMELTIVTPDRGLDNPIKRKLPSDMAIGKLKSSLARICGKQAGHVSLLVCPEGANVRDYLKEHNSEALLENRALNFYLNPGDVVVLRWS